MDRTKQHNRLHAQTTNSTDPSTPASPTFVVATFYHFIDLPEYAAWQQPLKELCEELELKGTILLAQEGINSTIAGKREAIDQLLDHLRNDPRLHNLEHKESYCAGLPFQRMKVRLKKEIVKLGIPDIDPRHRVGTYITPQEWNQLLTEPDVLVIDTRNNYEVEFGTFKGAVNPHIDTFGEFPEYVKQLDPQKHSKIAMFCTGGIRCEKASAYMLSQGFTEVYHLKGGILKYIEEIPPEQSIWEGECFVFDDRVSLDRIETRTETI
jgi:UPF0176 protein